MTLKNIGGKPLNAADRLKEFIDGINTYMSCKHLSPTPFNPEFALIRRSGAWYTLSTAIENKDDPTIKSWLLKNKIDPEKQEEVEKAFKYQGMERLTTFLENNELITNFIYDQIKEILL